MICVLNCANFGNMAYEKFGWTFPTGLLRVNITLSIFLLGYQFRELPLTEHKVILYQNIIVDPGLKIVNTICSDLVAFRQSMSLAKANQFSLLYKLVETVFYVQSAIVAGSTFGQL